MKQGDTQDERATINTDSDERIQAASEKETASFLGTPAVKRQQ